MTASDFGLCGPCWQDTPFIGGTVCASCGLPLPGEGDGYRVECDDCMRQPRNWDDGRAALLYQGNARSLVLALKHGDRPELAKPAAVWMAQAGKALFRSGMVIAPVPLHWSRMLKRRYNQSALLSHALGRKTGISVCPDLLVRKVRTSALEGKTAGQRADILQDSIVAHPRRYRELAGRQVLLVDDVMTSGATLTACTNACLKAGAAHISVLVLARVAKDT